MKSMFVFLVFLLIVSPIAAGDNAYFDVVKYGAKGDGVSDDSNAFLKAWKDTCSATRGFPTMLIPQGRRFMLQPSSFEGPCKSAYIRVMIMGTIIAPQKWENWKWVNNNYRESWIQFIHINGLDVSGRGMIDGQGASWWNKSQYERPTAVRFIGCSKLKLGPLRHINSPRNHIGIGSCNGALLSGLQITAPENSHNTDGIDIASSSNIFVEQSTISTGDDCIAINSGSKFINITGIFCGPGHGISVGSLGKNGNYDTVEEIHVRNVTFSGTTNGARIKTWVGGCGYARKITYEDIILDRVQNPVIIDQQYNAYKTLKGGRKAVKVSDVTYRNIRGTTISPAAINLGCDNIGCTNIILKDINIVGIGKNIPAASCKNVQGSSSFCTPKVPCLSSNDH
ncbi:probable polygalacturonase At3g15720 [Vicia villosa]|uniref:probable polygalacturonase At3g15720 n=1 Tax=Vicia villosa TaxID=3911 RepID=UPI00273C42F0|nr:probable polygalacturonase At3g15720 [Vicia villosa]